MDLQSFQNDGDSDPFNRLKETAIDASLTFIQERFQGLETDPVGNRNLLLLHGEHDIQALVDHFKVPLQRNNSHLQHCLEEWMNMKFHVQRVSENKKFRIVRVLMFPVAALIIKSFSLLSSVEKFIA